MNTARHPHFSPTPGAHVPLVDSAPANAELVRAAVMAGLDFSRPLKTLDGDHVRVIVIDAGHAFPLVGEIVDYHAGRTWLARWNIAGVYASSSAQARAKHSIAPNTPAEVFERPQNDVYTPAKPSPVRDGEGIIRDTETAKRPGTVPNPPVYDLPRFLLKDDPLAKADDPRERVSRHLIDRACAMMVGPVARKFGALSPDEAYAARIAKDQFDAFIGPFRQRFHAGYITADALVFTTAAHWAVQGALVVVGPVESVSAEDLSTALALLEHPNIKRVTVHSKREAANAA